MHRIDASPDIAIEIAAQTAAAVPGWVPIALSGIAIAIALISAWINWQAASPRIAVRLEASDQIWGYTHFNFRVINEGKTWVEDVKIRWDFDPTNVRTNPGKWSKDILMPGESFVASMMVPVSNVIGGDDYGTFSERVNDYMLISDETSGNSRFGTATYKRQIRLPFIRSRQRIVLPRVPDGFQAAGHVYFLERDAQSG